MLSLKDILSIENLISKKSQYTKKSNQKETYRLDHNPYTKQNSVNTHNSFSRPTYWNYYLLQVLMHCNKIVFTKRRTQEFLPWKKKHENGQDEDRQPCISINQFILKIWSVRWLWVTRRTSKKTESLSTHYIYYINNFLLQNRNNVAGKIIVKKG